MQHGDVPTKATLDYAERRLIEKQVLLLKLPVVFDLFRAKNAYRLVDFINEAGETLSVVAIAYRRHEISAL